ncbi:hypothetical protein [Candidatus Entotheonella palauensis]|uniref:Core-binding (CB) domain-containing protein n=1 Tax=Candidatus Entotheonella gemina TaxID=1429439 RepID=W4M741_9BACT|nr:hypothetical protein [Candidatus Entotheonella palauensis]ETX06169.1 MAG: hypothetical protein ETSY2_18735 [Candidatus Entotheonella gemina]
MLKTYFKRERTRITYAAGPAGPYLDEFSHWLEKRGFTPLTIRRCLFGADQFTSWAQTAGIAVQNLDATSLDAFRTHLAKHGQLRYTSGHSTPRCMGAHHFLSFLNAQGPVSAPDVCSTVVPTPLQTESQHMVACHLYDPELGEA